MKKEFTLERFAITALFALLCGIIPATFFGADGVVSVLFLASYPVLLFAILVGAVNRRTLPRPLIYAAACAVFALVGVAISAARAGGDLPLNSLSTFITFVCTLLFFGYAANLPQDTYTAHMPAIIGGGVLALMFTVGYPFLSEYLWGGDLTFRFYNPNVAGMFLMHIILYLVLAIPKTKSVFFRILLGTLILTCAYFLYRTECRSAILAIGAFLILSFFVWISKKDRIPTWLTVAMALTPLIFTVLYLVANEIGLLEYISMMEDDNKTSTSRVLVWQEALAIIKENFFTGDYAALYGADGIGQRHNIFMEVFSAYGVIPLCLFTATLLSCLIPLGKRADTFGKQLPLLAFFSVLLGGTFEAGFIMGALGLYILSGGFLAMAAAEIHPPLPDGEENTDGEACV